MLVRGYVSLAAVDRKSSISCCPPDETLANESSTLKIVVANR